MRSLRWMVPIAVVMCGAGTALAQGTAAPKLKRDPKSLDETMVWLRDSIRQTGGFAIGENRIRYDLHGQETCHLSWRTEAEGTDDLLGLYPAIEKHEDLKALVPESVRVTPTDVPGLLAGGTGQVGAGATGIYWKLAANSTDRTRTQQETLDFIFADQQTAQRIAAVLVRGIGECQGGKTPEPERQTSDAMPRPH